MPSPSSSAAIARLAFTSVVPGCPPVIDAIMSGALNLWPKNVVAIETPALSISGRHRCTSSRSSKPLSLDSTFSPVHMSRCSIFLFEVTIDLFSAYECAFFQFVFQEFSDVARLFGIEYPGGYAGAGERHQFHYFPMHAARHVDAPGARERSADLRDTGGRYFLYYLHLPVQDAVDIRAFPDAVGFQLPGQVDDQLVAGKDICTFHAVHGHIAMHYGHDVRPKHHFDDVQAHVLDPPVLEGTAG